MGKEGMTLQGFNHRHHAIMSADPKIVPLGNVMGQDHSGALADSGEHS
jgi:3D (Asp-Asp-Asp) domain-containing protein